MTRLCKLICLGMLALVAIPLHAQCDDCQRLSVDELFKLGQQTYSAKGYRILEMSVEEQLKSAKSRFLPDLQVEAEAGYWGQPVYTGGPHWQQNYGIQMSQPIYHGGGIKQNINLASIKQEVARLQSVANEADLRLELLGYYCNLLNLWEQKKVREKNIEKSQLRYNDVRNMYEKGVVTRNDVLRSSLQLSEDSLGYRNVINDISILSFRLATILGLDDRRPVLPDTTLAGYLKEMDTLLPMDSYIELAYGKQPEMLIARQRIKHAETELKLIRASNFPSIDFVAGYALSRPQARTFQNRYYNNWNIGLCLSYTFSALYKNKHNQLGKKQDILYYQNEESKKAQELAININNCYVKHKEARDNIRILQHSVVQARENYRILWNRYRNQLSILTDLLDANNVMLEAELQLTIARVDCIYTYYRLMHACGNL